MATPLIVNGGLRYSACCIEPFLGPESLPHGDALTATLESRSLSTRSVSSCRVGASPNASSGNAMIAPRSFKQLSNNGNDYTDTETADLLGISLGRLRNKLFAGQPLPPRIRPPGCRNRLWPGQAVHAWLEQFTVTVTDSESRSITRS